MPPLLSTTSYAYAFIQAGGGVEIRSSNLIHLTRALVLAGEKKLREAQLCLEGGQDVVGLNSSMAYIYDVCAYMLS